MIRSVVFMMFSCSSKLAACFNWFRIFGRWIISASFNLVEYSIRDAFHAFVKHVVKEDCRLSGIRSIIFDTRVINDCIFRTWTINWSINPNTFVNSGWSKSEAIDSSSAEKTWEIIRRRRMNLNMSSKRSKQLYWNKLRVAWAFYISICLSELIVCYHSIFEQLVFHTLKKWVWQIFHFHFLLRCIRGY